MVTLRADEHRYLVTASGRDEALVRRIPGAKFVASSGALQLPRQPGVVIALDRAFGDAGWEHPADLSQEVSETRNRQVVAAQHAATVTLSGNELAIECAFGDKELVKLVPGYRWSAPQRRWFVPASPMALEFLDEYFGEKLEVEEAAAKLIELRKVDEDAALERAHEKPLVSLSVSAPEPHAFESDGPERTVGDPLLERLDRLTGAVEQLVEALRGGLLIPAPAVVEQEPEQASPEPTGESAIDWRDLMTHLDSDPADVRDQANRQAQTSPPEHEPPLRAVAGLAMVRLGQYEDALGALRRAVERPGSIDEDLAREATRAYVTAVLALISADCGPSVPLKDESAFREQLLNELVNDSGFESEQLGSAAARTRLDYLVNDPVLRRIAPQLSDYCRIAHLLVVARGGQWMAANRIADILQERTLGDEGFALALILLANALYNGASLDEWDKAWPREDIQETLLGLGWLVERAESRLQKMGAQSTIAEPAALACLACVAGGPVEWASMSQRKALVQYVSLRHGARREYSEFLAAFQPAASGQKSVLGLFPGWTKVLAQTRLSRSAPYLMDVAANDHGGSGSLTWSMGESVYLQALELWGIDDAQTQLVDLLDLLEGGRRPDNYLNEAGRLVESRSLEWTRLVSREQRKILYQRALDVSLKQGHDRDSIEAFDRLVREFRDQGDLARDDLRVLCHRLIGGMKALRGPALEILLGMQLEDGEPFSETADQLLRLGILEDEARFEMQGLVEVFPALAEYVRGQAQKLGAEQADEVLPDAFPGKRLLVVGGHQWLKAHAKPVLEDAWGLKVTWLDPESAKNGPQSVSLAAGSADLVIINAACIGHAASGRVIAEARATGKQFIAHHSRGIGAMLAMTKRTLAAQPKRAPTPKR